MQDKFNPAFIEDFSEDDDSIYTEERREKLVDDDELEPWEEAWMTGYNSAE